MNTYFSSIKGFLLIGILALTTAFVGCKKDHDDTPEPDVAGLMVFNLIPDQPSVGFSLSGNNLGSPLEYLGYTGGYLSIFPGSRSADAYSGSNGNTLTSEKKTFLAEKYYSLFAVGTDEEYKNIIVNDGLDTLNAEEGHAYVRFVNAITGVEGPLQVKIEDEDGANTLFEGDADFGDVSDFYSLENGTIAFQVFSGEDTLQTREIELENRKAYTVLLADDEGTEEEPAVQIRYVENGTLTTEEEGGSN